MNYLTVSEAAEILRINKYTVYKWCETGRLPVRKFGKSLRFLESELEEFSRPQKTIRNKRETPK
jgi:excisionase family DNA binding protein